MSTPMMLGVMYLGRLCVNPITEPTPLWTSGIILIRVPLEISESSRVYIYYFTSSSALLVNIFALLYLPCSSIIIMGGGKYTR